MSFFFRFMNIVQNNFTMLHISSLRQKSQISVIKKTIKKSLSQNSYSSYILGIYSFYISFKNSLLIVSNKVLRSNNRKVHFILNIISK